MSIVAPRGRAANCKFRKSVILAAQNSRPMQQVLMGLCRDDITFWIDTFCWQVNPLIPGAEPGPFILYDFQREALAKTMAWLSKRRDVIWEKSRDLGATWLALLMQVHQALFFDYQKFLDISHTEKAVDNRDDPDCLYWKVRFVLSKLPDWMSRGAGGRTMMITFPATKGAMTGAATTERSGVGGRARWVFLDEFAKQKDDYAILGQTADTGPRHFVSTHYGVGTAWHSLTQREDIKRVVMHWSEHPRKNKGLYRSKPDGTYEILDKSFDFAKFCRERQAAEPEESFPDHYVFDTTGNPMGGPYPGIRSPWYDEECARRQNPRDIAMHLDIDVKGSVSQYFPAQLIYRLRQRTHLWVWEGELSYDPDAATPHALVERVGGPLKLWINPTAGGKVPFRQYVFGSDISHGQGATPSTISIFEVGTGRKVGEYENAHISAEPFAAYQVALARLFTDGDTGAFMIWERQGPGEVFSKRVIAMGYRNVYMKTSEEGLLEKRTDVPGWYPSQSARGILFDQYIAALADGSCTNPSDHSLEQTLNFRYDSQGYPEHPKQRQNKDDPSSGGVNHGDLVTADALAWKVVRDRLNKLVEEKKDEVPVNSILWRRQLRKMNQAAEAY